MSDTPKNDVLKDPDKVICSALQSNARASFSGIAESLGMSIPAVSERIHKLESAGVIKGYHASINPETLGYDVTAFIFVEIKTSLYYAAFIEQCKMLPGILECHAITGTASHLLKVRTFSMKTLEQLLSAIQQFDGVERTITNLVLSTHIETMQLPVSPAVVAGKGKKSANSENV